jgi:RES domain-containing protein
MRAYRLAKVQYTALDGEGARLYGGRWNSEGVAMVYLSSSAALAALEYLVHLEPGMLPRDLVLLTVEIPDDIEPNVMDPLLPDWNQYPAPNGCQAAGDEWVRSAQSTVILVPSVVVPMENNILLNPAHPDNQRIKIVETTPFPMDARFYRVGKP